jgi:thymidine kinase
MASKNMSVAEIITGPMSSNKTGTIICRYLNSEGNKTMVSNTGYVESRNGDTVLRNCMTHDTFSSLANDGSLSNTMTYFIDEAQFINNLVDMIEGSNATFVLSMLDMNYKGEYFPNYVAMSGIARKITTLRANCTQCDKQAMYSMLIGSSETLNKNMYAAVCGDCFDHVFPDMDDQHNYYYTRANNDQTVRTKHTGMSNFLTSATYSFCFTVGLIAFISYVKK